ncbi:M23 family metallopeptidase [Streptomyces sp. DH18]|uniref:M23 family metallopeptidase n=1 Tax=Streptomyces sp. DH18 TaxID=3040126 RepID=UPI002441FCEE|nr:M23 family metallopeptidase [Streptomyces sp. DH18]MDG9682192.1 M23 family metallopeptidase [Streptomyces sp. DH18]
MTRRTLLRGSAASFGLAVGGVLFSAGTAKAVDLFNPFSGYAMTDGWWDHINRGSLGGIDYAMGVGTGLPAAGAGTVTNIPYNGTGGHTVTITHSDGYRTQYMHLSAFHVSDGTWVGQGGHRRVLRWSCPSPGLGQLHRPARPLAPDHPGRHPRQPAGLPGRWR